MTCIDCEREIPDQMALVGALSILPGNSLLICKECVAKYQRSAEVDIRFDEYRRERDSPSASPEREDENTKGKGG